MARKKSARAPVKKVKHSRDPSWLRKPLRELQLQHVDEKERKRVLKQERDLQIERAREMILQLREYAGGFDAKDGFSTDVKKLARLHGNKYKKLRRASLALRDALSRPHIQVDTKNVKQRREAARVAGKILRDQKKFLLHTSLSSPIKSAKFVKGKIQIESKVKGGKTFTGYYLFPRKPRSWDDVIKMTKDIMKIGMRDGFYRVYNSVYGEIGESASRSKLLDLLEQVYSTYNRYLAGTILGFVWTGSDVGKAVEHKLKTMSIREKYRKQKLKVERDRNKRIQKRLKKVSKHK